MSNADKEKLVHSKTTLDLIQDEAEVSYESDISSKEEEKNSTN